MEVSGPSLFNGAPGPHACVRLRSKAHPFTSDPPSGSQKWYLHNFSHPSNSCHLYSAKSPAILWFPGQLTIVQVLSHIPPSSFFVFLHSVSSSQILRELVVYLGTSKNQKDLGVGRPMWIALWAGGPRSRAAPCSPWNGLFSTPSLAASPHAPQGLATLDHNCSFSPLLWLFYFEGKIWIRNPSHRESPRLLRSQPYFRTLRTATFSIVPALISVVKISLSLSPSRLLLHFLLSLDDK